jgi:hypothetical protein
MSRARTGRLMTFPTKNAAPHLRLERDLIMFAAMIANYLKTPRRILTGSGFFSTAFCAALRRHQIPLVKDILFLFCKQKSFFALYADCFDVGHRNTSLTLFVDRYGKNISHLRFSI